MSGRPLALLAGGRGPSCWAREVARCTARLDALRRACACVDALVTVRPRLSDESLLGNSLVVLAAGATGLAGAAPAAARSTQSKFTGLAASPTRKHRPAGQANWPTPRPRAGPPGDWRAVPPRTLHFPGKHRSRLPALDLRGLPHQVSHVLLRRLAGDLVASLGEELSSRSPAGAPGDGQHRRRPATPQMGAQGEVPALSPSASVALRGGQTKRPRRRLGVELGSRASEQTARRVWWERLVRRAGRVFHHADLPPAGPIAQGDEALARQWSAPIVGKTAPPELLSRLARPAQRDSVAVSSGNQYRAASDSAPDSRPPKTTAAGARSYGAMAPTPSPGRHQGTLLPLEGDDDRQAPEGARAESRLFERIAPPVVAPRLPPLISPELVGMSVPPVAATARQGAWAEATAAEDDLNALAAKIRRILDEEARRHGIDV